jgi:acetyl esterase/lipase
VVVPWLFLVVAIWGALWTLVSFHPPNRPPWLMVVGFFAAWSTTELAPIHIVWQVAATAVFVGLGALRSWPGWVGLGITVVSWLGLGSSVRGALQTDRAFVEALRDALGPDWDRSLEPALARTRRDVGWTRALLPMHFKRRGVRRTRNVQYAGDRVRRHRLDVYRQPHAPGARRGAGAPVLLQIHGGAWMIGRKDQQGLPLMYHLATRGWVCVAVNYRLSPRATWPDHLVDCKRALAWIRDNIAEYGGDPDFVVVTGGSAGGHLAALVGLTPNDARYQPGFEDADTSVQAMIPFYGVFDWTGSVVPNAGLRDLLERHVVKRRAADVPELFREASPLFHVRPDAPPALVVHGDLDTLAPIEQARAFVAALRATSRAPVAFVELQGAHHAFEVFNSIRTMHTVAGVELFLDWLLDVSAGRDALSPPAAGPTCSDRGAPPPNGPTPTGRTEPSRSPPA